MKGKEDLKELVENLDKIQAVQAPPSFHDKVNAYLEKEIENLRKKQGTIQEEIDKKNKEAATLRETLLVVNGALQGMQHVQSYVTQEAAESSSTVIANSSDSPAPPPAS